MSSNHQHPQSESETRRSINRVVVFLALAGYALVAVAGDALPEWAKYAIFGVAVVAVFAADAWEIGVRKVFDPDRWWRLVLLLLIAVAGFLWLLTGA